MNIDFWSTVNIYAHRLQQYYNWAHNLSEKSIWVKTSDLNHFKRSIYIYTLVQKVKMTDLSF